MHTSNQTNKRLSVAVIIANHNNQEWIKHAVDSAIGQASDKIKVRVYILDNGSSSEVQRYLKEDVVQEVWTIGRILPQNGLKDIDENDKIWLGITDEKWGPSKARNVAIQEAIYKGSDYVAILDSDDYWLRGKLEKSIEVLENNPKIAAVYTDNYRLYPDGRTDREFRPSFDQQLLLQRCYIHSGCVIRTSVLKEAGGYREDMFTAEDWDLWLRISHKYLMYHIPEPLVVARVHENNTTNSVQREVWESNWKKIGETIKGLYGRLSN